MKNALHTLLITTILVLLLLPSQFRARPVSTVPHLETLTYPLPIQLTSQTVLLHPNENRTLTFSPSLQLQNNTFLTGSITIITKNATIHPLFRTKVTLNQKTIEQQTQYQSDQNKTTILFATYNSIITQNPNFIQLSLYNMIQQTTLTIIIQGSVTIFPTQQYSSLETPMPIPIYPHVFTLNETRIQPLYAFIPRDSFSILNLTIISTEPNYQILTENNKHYYTTTRVLTNITLIQTDINDILLFTYEKHNQTTVPTAITLQAFISPVTLTYETNSLDTKFITVLFASLFYIIPLILRHYSYLQEQKKVNT